MRVMERKGKSERHIVLAEDNDDHALLASTVVRWIVFVGVLGVLYALGKVAGVF
jgi:hypothetical protein